MFAHDPLGGKRCRGFVGQDGGFGFAGFPGIKFRIAQGRLGRVQVGDKGDLRSVFVYGKVFEFLFALSFQQCGQLLFFSVEPINTRLHAAVVAGGGQEQALAVFGERILFYKTE